MGRRAPAGGDSATFTATAAGAGFWVTSARSDTRTVQRESLMLDDSPSRELGARLHSNSIALPSSQRSNSFGVAARLSYIVLFALATHGQAWTTPTSSETWRSHTAFIVIAMTRHCRCHFLGVTAALPKTSPFEGKTRLWLCVGRHVLVPTAYRNS